MPISGLGLSRGHSQNHTICSCSHLPHHTVKPFSPSPTRWHTHFSWQLRLALKMLSASKWPSCAISLPSSTRSLIFWSHWLISASSTCKNAVSTSKFHKPKSCWSYKWSPTSRRCKNLRFLQCSCRRFNSSEMLHYVWGYSSLHWKELHSLHTDKNIAPHHRRKRSSVTKKLHGLSHNSTI